MRRRPGSVIAAALLALGMFRGEAAAQPGGQSPWSGEPHCGPRFEELLERDAAFNQQSPRLEFTLREWQGERVIEARGGVGPNDAARLREMLDRHWPIDEVWFHSNGGVALQGTAIGRLLRQRGVGTRVRANAVCFSACTNAFLGGAIRTVEPRGCYGVHMFTAWGGTDGGERAVVLARRIAELVANRPRRDVERVLVEFLQEREQRAAVIARDQATFLQEMGVSAGFLNPVFDTAAPRGHFLTRPEIERYLIDNTRPPSPAPQLAQPAAPGPQVARPASPAPVAPSPAEPTIQREGEANGWLLERRIGDNRRICTLHHAVSTEHLLTLAWSDGLMIAVAKPGGPLSDRRVRFASASGGAWEAQLTPVAGTDIAAHFVPDQRLQAAVDAFRTMLNGQRPIEAELDGRRFQMPPPGQLTTLLDRCIGWLQQAPAAR